jgi:integrase
MSFKTIKQHRTEFPQIYEVEIGDKTKFRVLARKTGYLGKQEERFDTLKEAKDRAREISDSIKDKGLAEAAITVEDRYLILKAKELLTPYGVTVTDAAKFMVQHLEEQKKNQAHQTIAALAQEWLAGRVNGDYKIYRKATLRESKSTAMLVTSLWGARLANTIKKDEIVKYLLSGKWKLQTRANKRTQLHGFFEWVKTDKNQIKDNPVSGIKRFQGDSSEVEIFTVDKSIEILATVLRDEPDLIHYYLLGFFAGMRPDECFNMTVKNVTLAHGSSPGHIHIENTMTKINEARVIEMEPILVEWLKAYPLPSQKMVTPATNFKRRQSKLRGTLGYKHWEFNPEAEHYWIQDGIRHTYASYWLAVNQNRAGLAEYMGNSIEVIKEHYRRVIPKNDAQEFFKITPNVVKAKLKELTTTVQP